MSLLLCLVLFVMLSACVSIEKPDNVDLRGAKGSTGAQGDEGLSGLDEHPACDPSSVFCPDGRTTAQITQAVKACDATRDQKVQELYDRIERNYEGCFDLLPLYPLIRPTEENPHYLTGDIADSVANGEEQYVSADLKTFADFQRPIYRDQDLKIDCSADEITFSKRLVDNKDPEGSLFYTPYTECIDEVSQLWEIDFADLEFEHEQCLSDAKSTCEEAIAASSAIPKKPCVTAFGRTENEAMLDECSRIRREEVRELQKEIDQDKAICAKSDPDILFVDIHIWADGEVRYDASRNYEHLLSNSCLPCDKGICRNKSCRDCKAI